MNTTAKLGDIISLHYGKSLPKSRRVNGANPVFGSSGYVGTHKTAAVKGPGIIVGRKGTIGSVHWSHRDFFPIDTTYYVEVKHPSMSMRFAFYLLKSLPLSKMNTDAAVPGLNRKNAYQIKINLPQEKYQARIAQMLSAYDDSIKNNQRQIALLEESARLLYREWFGNKRNLRATSPAHKVLPTKPLVEIANLTMGQSPASKHYNKDGDGLPFHQGATSYGARFVEDKVYSTHTTKIAMPGDILLSVRAPVGRINITKNKIVLGRGLAAINSKAGFNSFLFYALKSFFFKEDIIGTGSIYAAVTKSQLEKVEIFYPPEEKIKRFESVVVPIDRKISNLYRQIQLLIKARDLLLPRLMDGRIKP